VGMVVYGRVNTGDGRWRLLCGRGYESKNLGTDCMYRRYSGNYTLLFKFSLLFCCSVV
jgi:hypothetical protein